MRRSILGVVSVSLLLSCGGGEVGTATGTASWRECTLVGCYSSVGLSTKFPAGAADLQTLSLQICRNGSCEILPVLWSERQPSVSDCRGAGRMYCSLLSRKDGTIELRLTLVNPPGEDVERYFQDGDRYKVSITAADGATLFVVDQAVTYHRFYPNGPECGPSCKSAVLTPSSAT